MPDTEMSQYVVINYVAELPQMVFNTLFPAESTQSSYFLNTAFSTSQQQAAWFTTDKEVKIPTPSKSCTSNYENLSQSSKVKALPLNVNASTLDLKDK